MSVSRAIVVASRVISMNESAI
jgi:hypothetical protein